MGRLFDPQAPVSPKKFPFFYGWLIVPMAAFGLLASMPGQTIGVGSFTPHLLETLRMEDESELTLAYMIGTICSGLLLPFVGRRIDKVGVRQVGVLVFICFGFVLLFMASLGYILDTLDNADNPSPSIAFTLVLVGYFFLRFLGQGVVSILPGLMIQRWFNRLRGRVAGIFNATVALGFSSSPLVLDFIIEIFGPTGAWVFLGCVMIFVMASLAYLFYRDSPEQCGLEMDGGWAPKKPDTAKTAARFHTYHDFTALEAVRTLPFWFFAIGLGFQSFTITAIFFHRKEMVGEMGITNDDFGSMLIGAACANICMNLVIGWMTERVALRNVLGIMLAGTCTLMAGVLTFPSNWGYVLWILGSGMSWASYGVLNNVTWPRYYGRAHLGSINGIFMSTLVFASALGPHYYSLIFQTEGAYLAAIKYSFIWPVAILCLFPFIQNPQRKYMPPEVAGDVPPPKA